MSHGYRSISARLGIASGSILFWYHQTRLMTISARAHTQAGSYEDMDSLSDASHTRKPQELWAIPLCWKGCFWELISAHSRLTLRRPSDDSVVLRVNLTET